MVQAKQIRRRTSRNPMYERVQNTSYKLTSFQIVDIFSLAIMNAGRIINRNKFLYGPGPLGRRPTGLGARPPLQGLVICAMQGIAVGLVGGLGYNVMFGNPLVNSIETYYKEHPSR